MQQTDQSTGLEKPDSRLDFPLDSPSSPLEELPSEHQVTTQESPFFDDHLIGSDDAVLPSEALEIHALLHDATLLPKHEDVERTKLSLHVGLARLVF